MQQTKIVFIVETVYRIVQVVYLHTVMLTNIKVLKVSVSTNRILSECCKLSRSRYETVSKFTYFVFTK